MSEGVVVAVHRNGIHALGKHREETVSLIAGHGVDGDTHAGETVQHRSRVARDPSLPNLRQVHLIHAELHDELAGKGLPVEPGQMGENVTTRGVDLLALPTGTLLRLGESAVVELTGLRNPCGQLEALHDGLREAVLERGAEGALVRKSGVMGIVLAGGRVSPGDPIVVAVPHGEHHPLEPV